MIRNVQITGAPDAHPEKPVYDAYDLASGNIDITKLRVKAHHVKVFDLMDEKDRESYEELYTDLLRRSIEGKIVISGNTRETLTKPDGSTGWYKYLEWSEFDTSEILGT